MIRTRVHTHVYEELACTHTSKQPNTGAYEITIAGYAQLHIHWTPPGFVCPLLRRLDGLILDQAWVKITKMRSAASPSLCSFKL
jgi:hypothetical protein